MLKVVTNNKINLNESNRPQGIIHKFFSDGFRPFFLFAALHACLMLLLWTAYVTNIIALDNTLLLSPVEWHFHELLFGYVPAVITGFLLTAVPKWTGRKQVRGGLLITIFCVWLLGRIVVGASVFLELSPVILPQWAVVVSSMLFLPFVSLVIGSEIIAGKSLRNLKILIIISALVLAHGIFYYEVINSTQNPIAAKMAISIVVLLITIIGGRIIPAFTRNWLNKRAKQAEMQSELPSLVTQKRPAEFNIFDVLTILATLFALILWVLSDSILNSLNSTSAEIENSFRPILGAILGFVSLMHFLRLVRWLPLSVLKEPLLLILHIGYLWVPLGFALAAFALHTQDYFVHAAAVHTWTVGAIGTMTIAVMTRATRGHSGRALIAPPSTLFIYLMILFAAISRVGAALLSDWSSILLPASGMAWILAFASFAWVYGRIILRLDTQDKN